MNKEAIRQDRRRLLKASGAGALAAITGTAVAAKEEAPRAQWDHEAEVVCVGSGAAAGTAAIIAKSQGASVLMVEKMPILGGTTAKSGGVLWIPNNFLLKQRGIVDAKQDCMRYMVRYAYPERYDASAPKLGLGDADHALIEALYDHGSDMVDALRRCGAVQFREFRLFQLDREAPDYGASLAENKVTSGRALQPDTDTPGTGPVLIELFEKWFAEKQLPVLTDTEVTGLIREEGRVIGVTAVADGKTLRIRATRGVIFGTGGFAHNVELIDLHQPSVYGACASPAATGDFIRIAGEAGAAMGALSTAWRSPVVLEECLSNRVLGTVSFWQPGDSMVLVDRFGHRVVNEKLNYNDRARIHHVFDPLHKEYPNQLLFAIYDARSVDLFGGSYPLPADLREASYLIKGETMGELARAIEQRLSQLASKTGGFKLADGFSKQLEKTVETFNGYAKAGKDPDFERGDRAYDRSWDAFFSVQRAGSTQLVNKLPNPTLHPFASKGPYYALIMAAGVLDTNAGPRINANAQVLDTAGKPIPGLYGAGNCIASPSRGAYLAAGGTIGLAMTYGYLAARHALVQGAQS